MDTVEHHRCGHGSYLVELLLNGRKERAQVISALEVVESDNAEIFRYAYPEALGDLDYLERDIVVASEGCFRPPRSIQIGPEYVLIVPLNFGIENGPHRCTKRGANQIRFDREFARVDSPTVACEPLDDARCLKIVGPDISDTPIALLEKMLNRLARKLMSDSHSHCFILTRNFHPQFLFSVTVLAFGPGIGFPC